MAVGRKLPGPVFVHPHGAVTAGVSSQCVMGIPLARQRSRRERHQICRVFCGLGWEDAELFPPIRLVLILVCFLLLWQRQLRMGNSSRNGVYVLMVLEFLAVCGHVTELTRLQPALQKTEAEALTTQTSSLWRAWTGTTWLSHHRRLE